MSRPSACPVSASFSAGHGRHPLQLLQDRASELSGVSFDEATEVDEINIASKLGESAMMQVSERFHKRVLADTEDEWWTSMWSGREDFPQDQADYLLQRFGGPSYFSDRKGNGALIDRHSKLEMTARTAERWLKHMHAALEETEELKPGQRSAMMNYFRHTAYFLVAAQEATREMIAVRPLTEDAPEDVPAPAFAKVWATEQEHLRVVLRPHAEGEGEGGDEGDSDELTIDSGSLA